jgi:transaldolase
LFANARSQRIYNAGARPQRLLWASTGTKDPQASEVLYVKALATPFTVDTIPEATLKALARHTEPDWRVTLQDGEHERVLQDFARAGVDVAALATRLQEDGARAFVDSWNDLLQVIDAKSAQLSRS